MATANQELQRQMDALYERYGKPLEAEHWGEYVAIAPDDRTVLAPTVLESTTEARHGEVHFRPCHLPDGAEPVAPVQHRVPGIYFSLALEPYLGLPVGPLAVSY